MTKDKSLLRHDAVSIGKVTGVSEKRSSSSFTLLGLCRKYTWRKEASV